MRVWAWGPPNGLIKVILVFQGRSIVMAVWRVNTATVTIASVSMALDRMGRAIRDVRDTDSR